MTHARSILLSTLLLTSTVACGAEQPDPAAPHEHQAGVADVAATDRGELPREEIERGREDPSWKRFVETDTLTAAEVDTAVESLDDITAARINEGPIHVPVGSGMSGPSVLAVQVLLDRARFSPGVMDGRWGKNTEKAVYFFQKENGLPTNGQADQTTIEALKRAVGDLEQVIRTHTLTDADVAGPFLSIPGDIYDQASLDCMCYESLSEKLAEMFHATPELLARLNPDVDLDAVAPGASIQVPAVPERRGSLRGPVARLVISDGGHYLHAMDAEGRILFHAPSTLGSKYAPSPSGDYTVESIHPDPQWHYQPALLTGVPDDRPDAMIPAGPNNAVGVVWMQLSKPHYGIHGTSAPETIGYATSHGCVRLTNWDAKALSEWIEPGVPVEFVHGNDPTQ